jgi:hypothetical protein
MRKKDAEEIVRNEFACYFLIDEVPEWTHDESGEVLANLAAESAQRLCRAASGAAGEVVTFLQALRQDSRHALLAEIAGWTLIDWRDEWPEFQQLISAIIEAVQSACGAGR